MEKWFRLQTSDAALQDPTGDGGAFGSLYKFVRVIFGTGYGVLITASVFVAIMAIMVYAIMLMMSSGGRQREETKRRITSGSIAVIAIFFILSLVTLIFGIFFAMSDYHA